MDRNLFTLFEQGVVDQVEALFRELIPPSAEYF
jgi:hypothetical protein